MKLSASKAAKLAGKSIPTITDALKSGRLSGNKLPTGGYEIELSELERVYGPLWVDGKELPKNLGHTTPNSDSALRVEFEVLRDRLTRLDTERERERRQLEDRITDLVERLDREGEERRKLTAILTDQRQKPWPDPAPPVEMPAAPASAAPQRGWRHRLLGR